MSSPHIRTRAHHLLNADMFTRPPQHLHFHGILIDGTGTLSYSSQHFYELAVLGNLDAIYKTDTGKAVFREFLGRSAHSLRIFPYEITSDYYNAYAQAVDGVHATPKGYFERSGADGKIVRDTGGHAIIGLGGGSNSNLSYTPNRWTQYCANRSPGIKAGAKPDEILFHEMVHATRQMRGLLDPEPLGDLYDTEEEFFAILLANIYASELGHPIDIRSDHHGFAHALSDTDDKFLPKRDIFDYRYRLVDKLVKQEPEMCAELAALKKIPFNPIRRYYELQNVDPSMIEDAAEGLYKSLNKLGDVLR